MFGLDQVKSAYNFCVKLISRTPVEIPINVEDTDSLAEISSAKSLLMARPNETLISAAKRNMDEIVRLDREIRQMRTEISELKRNRHKKHKNSR